MKLAKAPVKAQQPAVEEGEDMEEEESESSDKVSTKSTTIEVVEEVVVPREMHKPAEVKPKAMVGGPATEALPRRAYGASIAAMGQWAGGPPKDKMGVVVDEGTVRGRCPERPKTVAITPVTSSAEAGGDAGQWSADKYELVMPAFDDMEEPRVEIVVWTTEREDALKNVTEELMAD